jgi:WD40 repeat protein
VNVAPAARLGSPYKGLAPFDDNELDSLLFFGRERERDLIVANLVAARLTVLYGPSGVGKSSLLRAGVAHELRQRAQQSLELQGHPGFVVVVFDEWSDDPVPALSADVRAALGAVFGTALLEERADEALADRLGRWTNALECDVLLVLDQAEEYFVYHGGGSGFAAELPELITRPGLRVHVLVAIREDALAKLDRFKGRIPNLFSNYLRLEQLDREAGRAAILEPLKQYHRLGGERWSAEPALVESVLDQVGAGRIDYGLAGRGAVENGRDRTRVDAPYLQLVLERLWEAESERGSTVLHRGTLDELGGAARIVEQHLQRALASLDEPEKDTAANVFNHLVTPSGTKIAHAVGDLARYAGADEGRLHDVVERLAAQRILRPVTDGADGTSRYEIFHDVLADAVLAWRSRYEAERDLREAERRHRRAQFVVAATALALAVVAAIAVFALLQRRDARAQARHARARELIARSVSGLGTDPQQSLALALQAAGLERTPSAEAALRTALIGARLRRVLRLRAPVSTLAYTPDGLLLTGAADGRLVLWRQGRPLRAFRGAGPVVAVSLDRRGRHVLEAGGPDARVFDLRSGRRVATLRSEGLLLDAAFSSDGRRVLTASGNEVVVWRAGAGERVRAVRQPGAVARVVWAPDGISFATVGANRAGRVQARLYRANRVVHVFPQPGVSDIEFSPDGRLLATASYDGSTMLWRTRDGVLLRTLDDEGKAIRDVAFSPAGDLLGTASSDGATRVWGVATGDRFFYFPGHASAVNRVLFTPDGKYLVSASDDRTARIWTVGGIEVGKLAALLSGHHEAVAAVAVNRDGTQLATGSPDGTARLWDARIDQLLIPIDRKPARVAAAMPTAGGVAEVVGDQVEVTGRGESISVSSPLAFSADGSLVASARNATVDVERVSGGEKVAALRTPSDVTAVAFRRDGTQVITAGSDGRVEIWDAASGRMLHRFRARAPVLRVALSPDGDVALTADDKGSAVLWSADGEELHVLRGHPLLITDARFDPSGTRLVTASEGSLRNVIEWDVRTGRRLHELVGHFGTVTAASFSADGRWILTAGPISAAIWSAETGQLLFYLRGPTELLTDAEWTAGGYDVVTADRAGTVRTYTCVVCRPLDGLVKLARTRLARAH